MMKIARHEQIKAILQEQHQISVQELHERLGVSKVTIRNDLEALEHEGFLVRAHGGALINKFLESHETPGNTLPAPMSPMTPKKLPLARRRYALSTPMNGYSLAAVQPHIMWRVLW